MFAPSEHKQKSFHLQPECSKCIVMVQMGCVKQSESVSRDKIRAFLLQQRKSFEGNLKSVSML